MHSCTIVQKVYLQGRGGAWGAWVYRGWLGGWVRWGAQLPPATSVQCSAAASARAPPCLPASLPRAAFSLAALMMITRTLQQLSTWPCHSLEIHLPWPDQPPQVERCCAGGILALPLGHRRGCCRGQHHVPAAAWIDRSSWAPAAGAPGKGAGRHGSAPPQAPEILSRCPPLPTIRSLRSPAAALVGPASQEPTRTEFGLARTCCERQRLRPPRHVKDGWRARWATLETPKN